MVTSRSPLKNFWQDPRVEFVAIDFLAPVDTIIQKMLPLCRDVTHAFFTSYVHIDDFKKLRDMNVPLFENFMTAIDTVAGESLQRVCLQTGGKVQYFGSITVPLPCDGMLISLSQNYGCHLSPTEVPLHEAMPRYEDYGYNFYYSQEDFMFKLHAQRKWSWNVIRPGGIVGFTPGSKS